MQSKATRSVAARPVHPPLTVAPRRSTLASSRMGRVFTDAATMVATIAARPFVRSELPVAPRCAATERLTAAQRLITVTATATG